MERLLLDAFDTIGKVAELPVMDIKMPDDHVPHKCLTCGATQKSLFQGSTFGDNFDKFTCSFKCFNAYKERERVEEEREEKKKEKAEKEKDDEDEEVTCYF